MVRRGVGKKQLAAGATRSGGEMVATVAALAGGQVAAVVNRRIGHTPTHSAPALKLPEAIHLLAELAGWTDSAVIRDPTSAAEHAAKRCIDARDVIRASKTARRDGLK